MDFPGSITEQKTIKQTPIVIMSRKHYLASLKTGSNIIETIKVLRRGKTHKQCKTLFGLAFHQIIGQFEDWGWDSSTLLNIDRPTGVPVNNDMLRQYFYSLFPTYRDDKLITLSRMTTVEAATLYENIGNWSASQWSIVIPEPDPNWREKKEDNNG